MAKSKVVIEQTDEEFVPDAEVVTDEAATDEAATDEVVTDEAVADPVEDDKEVVLVVTAISSSGTRSTRNASGKIKKALPKGGALYAVEVSREAIPNWRVQNYWLTAEEAQAVAKATAEAGSGRKGKPNGTGGQVTAAQVIEARALLVEVH